jgi:hypothetical protein
MWWSRRAVVLHLTLFVVLPTFLGLFWWQVQRVRQGNTLSWAYVFEWPFFAGYAVYLWWKLVHEPMEGEARPGSPAGAAREGVEATGAAVAAPGSPTAAPGRLTRAQRRARRDQRADEDMAAYNRYLAELAEYDEEGDRPTHR